MSTLRDVPLDDPAWGWAPGATHPVELDGRAGVAFGDSVDLIASLGGIELTDGAIEIDMALSGERAFHGVVWRVTDRANTCYESFYVRPHQVGNDDSVQYNPVFNDVASWQLYHEPGFWAAVRFPMREWFTVRVAWAGPRAEVFVGDLSKPALVSQLKMPVAAGRIGMLIGGTGLSVARFAYGDGAPTFVGDPPPALAPVPGIVPAWRVSDAFVEPDPAPVVLAGDTFAGRTWTTLDAEPSGLVNLAIASGIQDGRNTVWARTTIAAARAGARPMHLGVSDRAVVYLNGRALFRGDDAYRSRDYRFLGSIGWWDTVYLPLEAGENDLAIAVSEDFGGWGVMARFDDLEGIDLHI